MDTAGEMPVHRPVLLHEVLDALLVQSSDIVLDATLGGAGHAKELVRALGKSGTFVGFDLDADAIERAKLALADSSAHVVLVEANFKDLKTELAHRGITKLSKALFDLGWSSYQLDSGRGFSLAADEPLTMTYSKNGGAVTAAVVVNEWGEETLADIIYGFGGERYSRRIAEAIVKQRARRPFTSSRKLADCIAESVPATYRHGRIHPATRTFQALRIAVNDELGASSQGIKAAFEMLSDGGRLAVLTFHSIEDRAVKQMFVAFEKDGVGKRLTKKPLTAGEEELRVNRRARSAKLRVIEKISTYGKENTKNQQI
jgi:16S rRNA (cytosine1402-N4)-methyltransferase